MSGQYQIQQFLLWLIHLERSAVLVLVAIGAGALGARLIVIRLRAPGEGPAAAWLKSVAFVSLPVTSLGVAVLAAYLAIRPDTFFLIQMGRGAVLREDSAAIIAYYEPLVRWDTNRLDVYENLASAYFNLRRPLDGIAVLHRALAAFPTARHNLICGAVHLAIGEVAEARLHVQAARPLAVSPEERAGVERLAAALPTPALSGR